MQIDRLDRMVRGWLIGDFDPAVLRTQDFEFGVKHYKAGASESWHYHKVATEVTVIVSGEARMNGRTLRAGDIVVLQPGEGSDFSCLSDVVTAVIKTPGAPDDKYTEREPNA
jgi:quercetin dioxygenase-like cupin family protein